MDPNERVKLMDSGLARFRCQGGLPQAVELVRTALSREGGRLERQGESELLLDHSDPWHWRYICARVEPSRMPDGSEGYAVTFREANSNTRLRGVLLTVALLLCIIGAGFLPGRWLRIVCAIAVAIAWLLLLLSPDPACLRRMRRIIQNIDETNESQ